MSKYEEAKERALAIVKQVPSDWREEIHDTVSGWDSELMFEGMSEEQAKKVLEYLQRGKFW